MITSLSLQRHTTSCQVTVLYLAPGPAHNDVLVVFGVRLNFDSLAAAGRLHPKVPYLCGKVAANLLLLCVETHALCSTHHMGANLHVLGGARNR